MGPASCLLREVRSKTYPRRDIPCARAPLALQPYEAPHAAHAVVARGKPLELDAAIEILALYPDHRSASGHRREQGDLIARADWVVAPDIVLIDGDPDNRQVAQCL